MAIPLTVTIYDPETNEVKATHTRSFIPWSILKRAIRVQNEIKDVANLTEQDIDEMAGLVVAAFGDQFSLEDAVHGMDIGEMATVLTAIMTRASGLAKAAPDMANPTRPAS